MNEVCLTFLCMDEFLWVIKLQSFCSFDCTSDRFLGLKLLVKEIYHILCSLGLKGLSSRQQLLILILKDYPVPCKVITG